MTTNPEAKITLIDCGHCGKRARGPRGWHSCLDCIRAIAREKRCQDCDSHATLVVADDHLHIDERHDPTCPSWAAYCAANNHDPDTDIIWTGE
jgi:hypothetical protein